MVQDITLPLPTASSCLLTARRSRDFLSPRSCGDNMQPSADLGTKIFDQSLHGRASLIVVVRIAD